MDVCVPHFQSVKFKFYMEPLVKIRNDNIPTKPEKEYDLDGACDRSRASPLCFIKQPSNQFIYFSNNRLTNT